MQFRLMAVLFVLIQLSGCSGGSPLTPVTGKITLDGSPLTRGSISLRPSDPSAKDEPYASVGADGSFTVMTKDRPGASNGKYAVLVTAYEDIDPKNPSAAPKSLVPRRYAAMDKPVLFIEVPSPNYDLALKSKP